MLVDFEPHDVFISYAREDSDWVRRHLYEPLRKCRTQDGRPPRIFFDVGEHGIQIGQDFRFVIEAAIEKAEKFVPVYSNRYFQKEMCRYELDLARGRDLHFHEQLLLPVLIDTDAVESIPFALKRLNFLQTGNNTLWFETLCQALEFHPSSEKLTVFFREQPGNVFASHTLPVVRVEVKSGDAPASYEEEISISVEGGGLLGTTTAMTSGGIASFEDLSISEPSEQTRLIAYSPTAGEAVSQPFSVVAQPAAPIASSQADPQRGQITIPVSGDVIFFDTGRHFAVVQPHQVLAYSVDGQSILPQPLQLNSPIRFARRHLGDLVLADWSGNIHLIRDDGTCMQWRFGENTQGFVVPADVDISPEGDIYAAFWSGSVFRLGEAGRADLVIRDPAGIQATAVYDGDLFTCDFDGNLRAYRNGRPHNAVIVESTIWLLMGTPHCMVGVGDDKFYHVSPGGSRVIDFEMPLREVASVYELSDLPIVIDTTGKAIRFDANLVVNATVHTQPGAEPVSADNRGEYCVFRNPDGGRTLLVGNRIVFSHQGALAVSPQGDRFALGDESSIQLYSQSAFLEQVAREEMEVGNAESGSAPV